jgi:hypothetical protein
MNLTEPVFNLMHQFAHVGQVHALPALLSPKKILRSTDGPGPPSQPASTCSSPTRPRRSPPRRGERRGGRQTTSLLLHSAAARRSPRRLAPTNPPPPRTLSSPAAAGARRRGQAGTATLSPISVLYLCTRAARGDLDPGSPAVATRDGSSLVIGSRARAM